LRNSAKKAVTAVITAAAGDRAQTRFWEFFVSNMGNPQTPAPMAA
jgi:hypothetical protein